MSHFILNREMEESIQESYILLSYAMQKGFEVDEQTIFIISEFKNYFTIDDADKKQLLLKEKDFWIAYNKISRIVDEKTKREVTIESIKNSMDYYRKPSSKLQRIKKKIIGFYKKGEHEQSYSLIDSILFWYIFSTGFMMCIFLILQIYWSIGSSFVQKGYETDVPLRENIQRIDNFNRLFTSKMDSGGKLNTPDSLPLFIEYSSLLKEANEPVYKLINNTRQINYWNNIWRDGLYIFRDNTNFNKINSLRKSIFKRNQETRALSMSDIMTKDSIFRRNYIDLKRIESIKNRESQSAIFVGQIIQNYLLPILAGVLGTLAFILRGINRKVKSDSFSKVSHTDYQLRITLGALAGVSASWIFPSKGLDSSYSPLLISFIVGYNIEVFFTAVDNVIHKYLSKDKDYTDSKKPENESGKKTKSDG